MTKTQLLLIIAIAASAVSITACKKKVAAAPHPAAPAASAAAPVSKPAPAPMRAAVTPAPSPAPSAAKKYPDAKTKARIDELLAKISDAYFDYDKATIRPDAQKALLADSTELRDILKDYPDYKLTIEGYCDERGSAEYNMALGDRRARAAKEYLVQVGIPGGQLTTVSYGKEHPVCTDPNEACYQKNRKIHIQGPAA